MDIVMNIEEVPEQDYAILHELATERNETIIRYTFAGIGGIMIIIAAWLILVLLYRVCRVFFFWLTDRRQKAVRDAKKRYS